MEIGYGQVAKLVTKINYVSHIIKYYGYAQECAELFKLLCKDSQKEWNDNQKAIVNVIMHNEECKMTMDLKEIRNEKVFEYLLKGDKFNYYSIMATVCRRSRYKSLTKFIENAIQRNTELGIENKNLFNSIFLDCSLYFFEMKKFIEDYDQSGLNLDKLYFKYTHSLLESVADGLEKYELPFIYIDEFYPNRVKSLDLFDKCMAMKIFRPCKITQDHLSKSYKNLKLEYPMIHDICELLGEDPFQNTCCKTLTFQLHDLMFGEDDYFNLDTLNKFCGYFPNLTRFEYDNVMDFNVLSQRLLIKDLSQGYSNLQRISSFQFGTEVYEEDRSIEVKKSEAKFIIKTKPSENNPEGFCAFQADQLCYIGNFNGPFDKKGDILMIRIKDMILSEKLDFIEFIRIQQKSCRAGTFAEAINRIKEFEDVQEGSIFILDIPEIIIKSVSKNIKIKNSIQNTRPSYSITVLCYRDTNPRVPSQIITDLEVEILSKIEETISKLQSQLVSIYFIPAASPPPTIFPSTKPLSPAPCLTPCLLTLLSETHLQELRCKHSLLDDLHTFDLFCEFLRQNTALRDLSLKLKQKGQCKKILEATQENYILKTLILHCPKITTEETILAKSFTDQRIALEIKLIQKNTQIYPPKKTPFVTYYPELC
ncbi:unnamed protein product [Moneuplotes crassus]|uniref:Uncharacterized protein n=1 Tax=Euplotes crassus TaxID=5936 RepID=A0AAD1U7K7_EUPCR|nr:unnamed protein product [Moneuplotes crassus]